MVGLVQMCGSTLILGFSGLEIVLDLGPLWVRLGKSSWLQGLV